MCYRPYSNTAEMLLDNQKRIKWHFSLQKIGTWEWWHVSDTTLDKSVEITNNSTKEKLVISYDDLYHHYVWSYIGPYNGRYTPQHLHRCGVLLYDYMP